MRHRLCTPLADSAHLHFQPYGDLRILKRVIPPMTETTHRPPRSQLRRNPVRPVRPEKFDWSDGIGDRPRGLRTVRPSAEIPERFRVAGESSWKKRRHPDGAASARHRSPRQVASAARRHLKLILVLTDLAAILVGGVLATILQQWISPVDSDLVRTQTTLLMVSLPVFLLGAAANRLYRSRDNKRRPDEWGKIARSTAIGVSTPVVFAFIIQNATLSRLWIILLLISIFTIWLIEREVIRRTFKVLRRNGRLRRRVAVLGTDTHALGLEQRLRANPSLGYDSVGLVTGDDLTTIEQFDELINWMETRGANGVIVSPSSFEPGELNRLTRLLTDAGYHTNVSSVLHDIDASRIRPQQIDGSSMLYVEPVQRNGWRRIAKRSFDLAIAITLLVVTAPLLTIAAIAVKTTSPGPIMFRQQRVGKHNGRFELLKLRSMVVDAEERKEGLLDQNEADGPLFKIENDPRVTRVGAFLRKTSIDELPQLVNVIRGEMSIVGPRPALPDEADRWDDELIERLAVLPGITGLWQVSGRSSSSFDDYRRLDLFYVDNWSLLHDIKICFRTVHTVFSGRGAS